MPHIFGISELNQAIKEVLEGEFPLVWVRGQVGNLSRPGSGHVYFTLKDDRASLQVVWFRSSQIGKGARQILQELDTGLEVLCAGRIVVYPPRGTYQLLAEQVELYGAGRLHLEFEALKQKLAARGWFAVENKRPLPGHPQRVGVITAPAGAALKDFLRLSQDRGWPGEIRIYPSLVQGQGAEENLAAALQEANLEAWAQVLVLIRGGGSLEDLWCFNSEEVAQAIHDSKIPVLTGIGHESDLSISDLVADLRASTPSHAAQLLWPERSRLAQELDELEGMLISSWQRLQAGKEQGLQELERALHWLSPRQGLQRKQELLQMLVPELQRRGQLLLQTKQACLQESAARLARCYSPREWDLQEAALQDLQARLLQAARQQVQDQEQKTRELGLRLQQADPEAPLARGYCLAWADKDQSLLRYQEQVDSGDLLWIRTYQDLIQARVEK
ncbi:MAG: exodeoxyribonuclease VII large subunit [Thermodesulfobacteriota bacterium]